MKNNNQRYTNKLDEIFPWRKVINVKQVIFITAFIFCLMFSNTHIVFADNQKIKEQLAIALDLLKKGDKNARREEKAG